MKRYFLYIAYIANDTMDEVATATIEATSMPAAMEKARAQLEAMEVDYTDLEIKEV